MSGGPKNYAFETDCGNTVQKVKGITVNYRASQIITLDNLEKNDLSRLRGRHCNLSAQNTKK